ncbi:MAG TPA: hypothetical protein P5144_10280 [Thermoanaerobaculia bacterium]|nr:hypothetical protein [Thermoanaerobaculia bacterium]
MKGKRFHTLREAIHATATSGGIPMKALAADLDLSPSNLSQRTTLGEDGIPFPADDRLIRIQQLTGDHSILATMAEALGYELRPRQDRLPDILQDIQATQKELNRKVEQLVITIPFADAVRSSRK